LNNSVYVYYYFFHIFPVFLVQSFLCIALMFLKKGSVIFEVFPYKYYRPTYYPLSLVFGVHYQKMHNPTLSQCGSSNGAAAVPDSSSWISDSGVVGNNTFNEEHAAHSSGSTTLPGKQDEKATTSWAQSFAGVLLHSATDTSTGRGNPLADTVLGMVSGGACMRDIRCRSYARSRNICMPESHLQLLHRLLLAVEAAELGVHNAPHVPVLVPSPASASDVA
jgi:hypothetical protein